MQSRPDHYHCECYKKLEALGIPLYINEETEFYAEDRKVILYENAFRLPGFLKINESITEYPIVEDNELFLVFERMARVIPKLSDFSQNLLSFWILDVIIEGLWSAQNADMSHEHQKATLMWIAYFLNYIQRHNPSRRSLFKHLKNVLFSEDLEKHEEKNVEVYSTKQNESSSIKTIWKLPLPPELTNNEPDDVEVTSDSNDAPDNDAEPLVQKSDFFEKELENDSDTNVKHMNTILEILYRIFARLWVYMEIQAAFHAMPTAEVVDLPFKLHLPKPLMSLEAYPYKIRPRFIGSSEGEFEGEDTEYAKNEFILPLQAADESQLITKKVFGEFTSDTGPKKSRDEKVKKVR